MWTVSMEVGGGNSGEQLESEVPKMGAMASTTSDAHLPSSATPLELMTALLLQSEILLKSAASQAVNFCCQIGCDWILI